MKKQPEPKGNAFLFFVFAALILVFAVVAVMQIRVAQFNARLSSIEESVTRIENSVGKFVGVMQRYDKAYESAKGFPESADNRIQVGVGDRKEETK